MAAPAPMQFAPLQFAQQGPGLGAQLQGLAKAAGPAVGMMKGVMTPGPIAPGGPIPGAEGPTSAGGPSGPAPLAPPNANPAAAGAPGSPYAGPVNPTPQAPGIMEALKGMSPQGILDVLRNMSAQGQKVIPPGMPGSAALTGAGMIPGG